ncbi:MAG: DRTGG domain-containing protein [Bacillota bacterium]
MTFQDITGILKAEIYAGAQHLPKEVQTGYAGDLLSEVMANAKEGQLWLTIQTHPNIVAVALLINLGAVIITGGHRPEPATVAKAKSEGILLMATAYHTFEAIRILSKAGF